MGGEGDDSAVFAVIVFLLCSFFLLANPAHTLRGAFDPLAIPHQTKTPPNRVVFSFGGEGEIRTLEPISGLHDFQSCALDQLRDFSVLLATVSIISCFFLFVNIKIEKILFFSKKLLTMQIHCVIIVGSAKDSRFQ